MNNYELLLKINEIAKENIKEANTSGKIEELSRCIAFSDDLQVWLSYCGDFSEYLLAKESLAECINSIFMCAQGFYKEAISTLRQCLEHMLFAILLSSNDYKYRLWQAGQIDMSWAQLMNNQDGVYGIQFIRMYAKDIDEQKSIELLTVAKNVYRECSEFVHGNFEKLSSLPANLVYDENAFNRYIACFESIKYAICMALFIRFREILNEPETLKHLESVLADNLGTIAEIQQLLNNEGGIDIE